MPHMGAGVQSLVHKQRDATAAKPTSSANRQLAKAFKDQSLTTERTCAAVSVCRGITAPSVTGAVAVATAAHSASVSAPRRTMLARALLLRVSCDKNIFRAGAHAQRLHLRRTARSQAH
jgi:hypothetical protein